MRTTVTAVGISARCVSVAGLVLTVGCGGGDRGEELENQGVHVPGAADDDDDDDAADGADGSEDPGVDDPDGGDDDDDDAAGDDDDDDDGEPADQGPELPYDPAQLDKVCARNSSDRVAQTLCSGAQITSVADLQDALAFENPFFALTANSSSLVARGVNALNPRLIMGDKLGQTDDFGFGEVDNLLVMGFARGEQLVELMAFDPIAEDLNFYLLLFEQACNDTEEGCSAADLVTPAVEENWSRWTVYQDVDLENTTFDCMVCHQPLGPSSPKIPRLQEVNNSWTHWFPVHPVQTGGGWSTGDTFSDGVPPSDPNHGTHSSEVLWDMFSRMHEQEGVYGGVPLEEIQGAAAGPDMETFVASYMALQVQDPGLMVPFGHVEIASDLYVDSPSMEVSGAASGWEQQYARSVAGARLPVPSHRVDITSETLREPAIESYLAVLNGAPADTLMDPRDVVSGEVLAEMSLLPEATASGEEILRHMCSRCHNGDLDQSLSRAKFDATTLAWLDDEEKGLIADRIARGPEDKLLMPPPRYGTLPQWARERVLAYLGQ